MTVIEQATRHVKWIAFVNEIEKLRMQSTDVYETHALQGIYLTCRVEKQYTPIVAEEVESKLNGILSGHAGLLSAWKRLNGVD